MDDIRFAERGGASEIDDIIDASVSGSMLPSVAADRLVDPDAEFDDEEGAEIFEFVVGEGADDDLNDAALHLSKNMESLIAFKDDIERLSREFFEENKGDEFIAGVEELAAPHFHNQVAKVLLMTAIHVSGSDGKDDYESTMHLIDTLCDRDLVNESQLQSAMRRVFNHMAELTVANPRAFDIASQVGEFLADNGRLANDWVRALIAQSEFERDGERVRALKHRITTVLDEYLASGDHEEAIRSLRELHTPFYMHEAVKKAISLSLDRDNRCRESVSRFLAYAIGEKMHEIYESAHPESDEIAPHVLKFAIGRDAACRGFEVLLERVEDLYKDVPDVLKYLAKFIARAIFDEAIPHSFLDNVALLETDMGYVAVTHARELLESKFLSTRMTTIWGLSAETPIDDLKKAVKGLVKEFLVEEDINETATLIKEMNVPDFSHEVVKQLVLGVADYVPPGGIDGPVDESFREAKGDLAVTLLSVTLKNNIISRAQVRKGLEIVKKRLSDYKLDIPKIEHHLTAFYAALESELVETTSVSPDSEEAEEKSAAAVGTAAGVVAEATLVKDV